MFLSFYAESNKKLPELRSKNKVLKDYAKDLLASIRLLCFIDLNKIDNFYSQIKDKYRSKFPKYFKYFDKNYINNYSRFSKIWNFNEII